MRLRLRIHRNELPTVSALWPVPYTNIRNTIAQLLVSVNGIFPLESDTWDLDDYSVSIGGYECLHYHELGAVCKDEDEVVIKPLQYADIRARTLLGRAQISRDGRHLLDGVPFGKPQLRAPVRPDVRIPKRKLRKLIEEPGDRDTRIDHDTAFTDERFEELESDGDDEEDNDFDVEEHDDASETADPSSEDDTTDEEDDSSETSSTSDSDTDSSDQASDKSWNGCPKSVPSTPPGKGSTSYPVEDSSRTLASSASTKPGPELTNGVKRKRQSEDGSEAAEVEQHTRTQGTGKSALPHQGKIETKLRNARRRDTTKLRHLRQKGLLPQGAGLTALREYEQRHTQDIVSEVNDEQDDQQDANAMDVDIDLKDAEDTAAAGAATGASVDDPTLSPIHAVAELAVPDMQNADHTEVSQEQRQQLLDAIASGGVDVTVTKLSKRAKRKNRKKQLEDPPEELSSKEVTADQTTTEVHVETVVDAAIDEVHGKASPMMPPSTTRRSKLDLAGSNRLVFGSLGVRVPKTQDEKDALQKKLAGRPVRTAAKPEAMQTLHESATNGSNITGKPDGEEDEDPEAWRSKIDLSAVECCDEDVTLATPPFPFHQSWDPRYPPSKKRKKRKRPNQQSTTKRRGKGARNGDVEGYVETYDKYNEDGTGDALQYDEVDENEEYWEEGALLDGEYEDVGDDEAASQQLLKEAARHEREDSFPALPGEITVLPPLAEADAQEHDYVVYEELVCSAVTEWQPKTLTRTAQLRKKTENAGWEVLFALRDQTLKEYDEEGNRVYSKFEMEGMSDDEDDEGEKTGLMEWEQLGTPRLLLRPTAGPDGA